MDDEMDDDCGHCGTRHSLESMEQVRVAQWTHYAEGYGEMAYAKFVAVSRCRACEEVTIWRYVWSDDMGEAFAEERLYPTKRDNSALPEEVRRQLDAALRVKMIDPGLYAVAIRRMLETVFTQQGATGRDLYAKVKYLVDNEGLPTTVADAASRLRDLGKYGAHDEEVEVVAADVPAIEDLANAILEYLYRAPATINALTESVKGRGGTISSGG
jgi:hypothetical protein